MSTNQELVKKEDPVIEFDQEDNKKPQQVQQQKEEEKKDEEKKEEPNQPIQAQNLDQKNYEKPSEIPFVEKEQEISLGSKIYRYFFGIKYDDDEKTVSLKQNDNQYDLTSNLELTCRLKYQTIKLDDKQNQNIPGIISIRTKDSIKNDRVPIDLICVIDHSGSMHGKKMDLVKETLITLLDFLGENDRFSLIYFDDKAQRLCTLKRVSNQNKNLLISKINMMQADGGTNINLGMEHAFKQIKDRDYKNPITSIFLLTDGQDNTSRNDIQNTMKKFSIKEQFSINCFGYGDDHNAKQLESIAQLKQGTSYYIDNIEKVDECFVSALGGLMSIVGKALKIVIKQNKKGLEYYLNQVFGECWTYYGQNQAISVNELLCGVSKDFVFEIVVPPTEQIYRGEMREQQLFELELSVTKLLGQKEVQLNMNKKVNIKIINRDEERADFEDGEVMENYFRVKAAQAMEQGMINALHSAEAGKKIVQLVIDDIESNKFVRKEKLCDLVTDLRKAQQQYNPENMKKQGKNIVRNLQRGHMEQKAQVWSNDQSQSQFNEVKESNFNKANNKESEDLEENVMQYSNSNQIQMQKNVQQRKHLRK